MIMKCKRKELLRGSLSLGLKKRMVKVLVWSVVSYGSERSSKEGFKEGKLLEDQEQCYWMH